MNVSIDSGGCSPAVLGARRSRCQGSCRLPACRRRAAAARSRATATGRPASRWPLPQRHRAADEHRGVEDRRRGFADDVSGLPGRAQVADRVLRRRVRGPEQRLARDDRHQDRGAGENQQRRAEFLDGVSGMRTDRVAKAALHRHGPRLGPGHRGPPAGEPGSGPWGVCRGGVLVCIPPLSRRPAIRSIRGCPLTAAVRPVDGSPVRLVATRASERERQPSNAGIRRRRRRACGVDA